MPTPNGKPALPNVPAYGLAFVLAEVEKAIQGGHSPDDVARYLWAQSIAALAGRQRQRQNLVCVLRSWAHLIEADIEGEAAIARDPWPARKRA